MIKVGVKTKTSQTRTIRMNIPPVIRLNRNTRRCFCSISESSLKLTGTRVTLLNDGVQRKRKPGCKVRAISLCQGHGCITSDSTVVLMREFGVQKKFHFQVATKKTKRPWCLEDVLWEIKCFLWCNEVHLGQFPREEACRRWLPFTTIPAVWKKLRNQESSEFTFQSKVVLKFFKSTRYPTLQWLQNVYIQFSKRKHQLSLGK